DRVVEILADVHEVNPDGHHFGPAYVTAYHIAIELERRRPDIVEAIGKPIGGAGVGQHDSLAQYVSNQLSRRIRAHQGADTQFPIEGAFLSNEHLREMVYGRADGTELRSSVAGTRYDLA